MGSVDLILVGGFLGAGKTTLLLAAARDLARQGRRVGLITNDQAADLVDTAILKGRGLAVQEIAGGCFCCRFGNLITSADLLMRQVRPDVLIAEPVGSCTDLSATVLQPLKRLYADRFRVAPFSVLADPARLAETLAPGPQAALPSDVAYIFRKQLEEADLVVLNKADLLSPDDRRRLAGLVEAAFPGRPVLAMSALTGEGVPEWLKRLETIGPAGQRIAEVDYDIYAAGEARLGWLNATLALRAGGTVDWAAACLALLEAVRTGALARGGEIAHVKLYLDTAAGPLLGSLTSTAAQPAVRSAIRGEAREGVLTLNARVGLAPEALREIVEQALRAVQDAHGIAATVQELECLKPGRPEPVHRFDEPV